MNLATAIRKLTAVFGGFTNDGPRAGQCHQRSSGVSTRSRSRRRCNGNERPFADMVRTPATCPSNELGDARDEVLHRCDTSGASTATVDHVVGIHGITKGQPTLFRGIRV